jgi:endonuclease/exonuclease/phosphatase (EEP) superfamily protein YafD
MTIAVLRRRLRLAALLFLYASLAGLVASTVLAELGQTWWMADLFAHFRYHYVLGALLLLAVALALGRRGAGIAAAFLIIPQLWAVAAPPRTPAAPDAAVHTRLRVMSVNVLWSNPRFNDVVRTIEREAPDIVSLQEVSPQWHGVVERLAARLPHVAPADWRAYTSDNILLSRFPIVESRVVVPPNQNRPRSFAHVEATLAVNGKLVRVLAVHPPLPNGSYLTAIRQLHFDYYAQLAARTELPLLIVGDFNITPYSPRFRALLREGGLRYVHLGWNWPRSWPSDNYGPLQRYVRGFPIDHVLTSRHFAAASARALEDVGSDHYPVLADLVLVR